MVYGQGQDQRDHAHCFRSRESVFCLSTTSGAIPMLFALVRIHIPSDLTIVKTITDQGQQQSSAATTTTHPQVHVDHHAYLTSVSSTPLFLIRGSWHLLIFFFLLGATGAHSCEGEAEHGRNQDLAF